jgi:hypothetical protein
MKIFEILTEIKRRNSLLYYFGWANLGLLVFALAGFVWDDTRITGIHAWIKPAKFALSVWLYVWTFGWLLYYLPQSRQVKWISYLIVVCMLIENTAIFMQAFRGVRSHFNVSTAFDATVFSIMGVFIAINTFIVLWVLILFFSPGVKLSSVMLHAWRAGIFLFFIGGVSGGIMSGTLAHSVGVPDGGSGLPFLNWSTIAGDLRIPHFFTLHGLQVMAWFGWWNSKRTESTVPITIFFLGYCIFSVALHIFALEGKSIFPF